MPTAAGPILAHLAKAAADAGLAIEVTPETGLLESGLLDSMGMVGLVQFLEAEFDLDIPEGDIGPELFATPASIIAYVDGRRG